MVKLKTGKWWKTLLCRHNWEYLFFEQLSSQSYRYIKMCRKCEARELFATKDMEDLPWE